MRTIQLNSWRSLLAVIVVGLCGVFARAHDCSSERAKEAAKLWEAAIAAKGGHQRLDEIRVLYVEQRPYGSSFDSSKFPLAIGLYAFPDRAFMHLSFDPTRQIISIQSHGKLQSASNIPAFDSSAQRGIVGSTDAIDVETATKFLMETHWVKPVPICSYRDTIKSVHVDVVETSVDGLKIFFSLDNSSHLPLKIVYRYAVAGLEERKPDHIILLGDYTLVDGVMMPGWIGTPTEKPNDVSRSSATYLFNVEYNADVFEHAPTKDMKSDAWRRKP